MLNIFCHFLGRPTLKRSTYNHLHNLKVSLYYLFDDVNFVCSGAQLGWAYLNFHSSNFHVYSVQSHKTDR